MDAEKSGILRSLSIRLGLRVAYYEARGMLSCGRCTLAHTELGWMEFHSC